MLSPSDVNSVSPCIPLMSALFPPVSNSGIPRSKENVHTLGPPQGPRHNPTVVSWGGGRFPISEVPLYANKNFNAKNFQVEKSTTTKPRAEPSTPNPQPQTLNPQP